MNINKHKKLFRVVFCANQVSLCIAVELAKRDQHRLDTVIFCMPERCDLLAYQDCGVKLIPYTRLNFVKFLIITLLDRPDEVCVPHMRIGRLINKYAKYAKALSAIDDGMDTFREKPKNISPEFFPSAASYYTFTYDFSLSTWLSRFSIQKICDIRNLAISSRPQALLLNITEIVIESPGIDDTHVQLSSEVSSVLLVKHSNRYKHSINIAGMVQVNGAEIGLEKTIDSFAGSMIVGESMVMVYALLCGRSDLKINVILTQNVFDNLRCLQSQLCRPSRNGLSLSII